MQYLGAKGHADHSGELIHACLHLLQGFAILVEVNLLGGLGDNRSSAPKRTTPNIEVSKVWKGRNGE
jgi:hypothetical protein